MIFYSVAHGEERVGSYINVLVLREVNFAEVMALHLLHIVAEFADKATLEQAWALEVLK